ncbi:MAG TPA: tripartite tricarboxylate transporter substrate binding protein [Burkholderiales bacterium]|jgi:tripartite-type tricarboxylate transporter receptor subunit TctC|nr:tripartite tricarboxylate transporter substrate binding protein [Burkholderiales bacterium]
MRLLMAVLFALASSLACAQGYPSKPVRLIIPFPPGGSNDLVARAVATQLSERLGQSVVVDNRGGGGGTIGINAAAKSPADGYTLLLVSVGWPVSIALKWMPEESLQWFVPAAPIGTGPSLLVVPTALPVNSVQELIALAKSKPGQLNASAAGPGSFQHLATELFRLQAGINIVIVQYKGGGPALTDTIAGQVQMNIGSAVQNIPHVKTGKLRALGVGGKTRLAALPDVPTFAEAGLPGAEATNWWGIMAPTGTPSAALERLQKDVAAVVDSPEMKKRFEVEGAEALHLSPRDFGALIAAETAKWTQVVKQAGIKAE